MQRIRDESQLASTPSAIRQHLLCLMSEAARCWDGMPLGSLAIAEPGDSMALLEAALAWPIFGGAGHLPTWEWIALLDGFYEIACITADSGVFILLIVPVLDGIDPHLLEFCRAHMRLAETATQACQTPPNCSS